MMHDKISILSASEGTNKPHCPLPGFPGVFPTLPVGPGVPFQHNPTWHWPSLSLQRYLMAWAAPACPAPSKTRAQTVIFEGCVGIQCYYKETCVPNWLFLAVTFCNSYPFQNMGICFHLFSGMTYLLTIHSHSTVKYDGRS